MSETAMFGTSDGKPMTPEESCGASTPEDFADWLIKYHGLIPESRETVILNLKTQGRAQRTIGYLKGSVKNEIHIHFSLFGNRSGDVKSELKDKLLQE